MSERKVHRSRTRCALLTLISMFLWLQPAAAQGFQGIQVGSNAKLTMAPGYGLPLYVRAKGLADGNYEVKIRGCGCEESCDVLRTQRVSGVNGSISPEKVWREVEPVHAFRARLVDGVCVDPQTGYRVPDWVNEACGTDCFKKEEGKDAERFDFSVSIHTVKGGTTDETQLYCAGTFGWRNGTAGHWVVAARPDKLARSAENDWPLGYVRTNSVVVPEGRALGQALHVVAGGLDASADYYIAIKTHAADGFEVGDTVDKAYVNRQNRLQKTLTKLRRGQTVRTARLVTARTLKKQVKKTYDLVLLKAIDAQRYEVKALDNPETPGFTIQRPIPDSKPDSDLLQKGLTYKVEFGVGEPISVGINPPYAVQCQGQTTDIHVMQSNCTLKDAQPLAESGCTQLVSLKVPIQPGCRNVNTHEVVNSEKLGPGTYCTVIDINRDGNYDRGLDVADGCVTDDPTPGFAVIKAPPEPVEPNLCEQFALLRDEVQEKVNSLSSYSKLHLALEEGWTHCEQFSWSIGVRNPPENQPRPGDPEFQSSTVAKRMIKITDLIVDAVQDFDMRIELDVLGSADAIPIGRERPYDGPPQIELEDETLDVDAETQITNKLLAALRAWKLSDAIHKKDAFKGLKVNGRTKTTLRIQLQPEDENGLRGSTHRAGQIKLMVILDADPGRSG